MRLGRASRIDRLAFTVLSTPVFLGSVVVLLTNDHLLKWAFPGLVTGKISDFAGPVMVATVASVIVGRRVGFACTVVGFVALKTVPGVAEAAAPVLGGVTRRDPTDVVGLLALPLLWRWLAGFETARDASPVAPRRVQGTGEVRTGLSSWLRTRVLPLGAAVLGLVALTATSPPPDPPEVEKLWVSGSTVYAQLTPEEYSDDPVLRSMSADGGRSWARLDGGIPTDAEPASGRACRSDGICFDAMGGSIRETRLDGETKTSFELSRSQRAALDWRRPDGGAHPDDMFIHVAVIRGPDGESVVASAKDQGVVVLGPSGRWTRIAVLGAEPTSLSGSVFAMNVATFALLASMPIALVATVATALTRQHRNGWTKAGSAVGGLVFGGVFWAAGVGVWALGSFNRADPNRTAIILTLLALATLLVPVSAVRATGRRRPSTPSS